MRPIRLPDDFELRQGERKAVFSAPDGDLMHDNIRPVEAVVTVEEGEVWYALMVIPEGDDLQRLQEGQPIWLSFRDGVPVFAVEVARPV